MDIQKGAIPQFVVKRAFRHGSVSRQDIINAFGFNAVKATRVLSDALLKFSDLLERRGKLVYPKPGVEIPELAHEAALFKELDRGEIDPRLTGIFRGELPVHYVSWVDSHPPEKGILLKIVQAIKKNAILKIVYIGMKKNDQPSERKVIPLALERMNDQWRLIAQDIRTTMTKERRKRHEAVLRSFVLSRILKAEWDMGRRPKGFVEVGHWDDLEEISVTPNPLFTTMQKEVIQREMKIENGKVRIPSRSRFEFERRFMDAPPNPEAVWPPIIKKGH